MRHATRGLLALAAAAFAVFATDAPGLGGGKKDDIIVINMKGTGAQSYVRDGDKDTKPVTVKVGQKVKWVNLHDDTHTATSVAKDKDGKEIFDTDDIDPKESKTIVFDEALFKRAGGKPGEKVELKYICTYHKKTMESKIILESGK
jgi:plastocyanin